MADRQGTPGVFVCDWCQRAPADGVNELGVAMCSLCAAGLQVLGLELVRTPDPLHRNTGGFKVQRAGGGTVQS
jgi:hypothetical protein